MTLARRRGGCCANRCLHQAWVNKKKPCLGIIVPRGDLLPPPAESSVLTPSPLHPFNNAFSNCQHYPALLLHHVLILLLTHYLTCCLLLSLFFFFFSMFFPILRASYFSTALGNATSICIFLYLVSFSPTIATYFLGCVLRMTPFSLNSF